MLPKRLFITGTDTDIGKTHCSAELLNRFNAEGKRTTALKPVSAGGLSDAVALQAACSEPLSIEAINPIQLGAACSLHLAAALENKALQTSTILAQCEQTLAVPSDICVIEGAGGWLSPLNDTETIADLAIAFKCPVVLVVGIRLGCLNHSLLTVQSIQQSGLTLYGWIANQIQSDAEYQEENIAYLQAHIPAPLLFSQPWNYTP